MNFLACPNCVYELPASAEGVDEAVRCANCGTSFRFQNGIWFTQMEYADELSKNTIEAFGKRWLNIYSKMGGLKDFFLPTIHPVAQDFFHNKVILDAGGGFGRLTKLMLDYGAKHVVLLDGSMAVLAAAQYLKDYRDRVTIVQGDLLNPPVLRKAFDVVLCHGVLHHTGAPSSGVSSLASLLKPATGNLILWVYAKEGNRFMRIVTDAFRSISLRMSDKTRWSLAACIDLFLWLMATCVYSPMDRLFGIKDKLWYGEYFLDFLFVPHINNRVDRLQLYHDFLTSEIVEYYSRDQIEKWLNDAGFKNVYISFYRGQSWSVAASFDLNENFKG